MKSVKILFIERSNLFDALANDEQITITAHQLPIVGNSITVATLLANDKLLDCFEELKEKLNNSLKEILLIN